jgi:hypothetical protein
MSEQTTRWRSVSTDWRVQVYPASDITQRVGEVTVPYYETDGRYGYAMVHAVYRVFHIPSGEPQHPDYLNEDDAKARVIELEQTPHVFPDDMPPSLVEAFRQVMWFICPGCEKATPPDMGGDGPLCDSCQALISAAPILMLASIKALNEKDPLPW